MIKVTVILPVFNAEKSVKKTIESVLKQTFKDFELIVINDGSTDDSLKVCQEIQKKDDRIVIKNIENNGVSNARNIGLKMAQGEYIMFIDSDDEYFPTTLEKMVKNIEFSDLCVCNFSISKDNVLIKSKKLNTDYKFCNINNDIIFLQKNNLFNVVWNKIYKRKTISENNIEFNKDISIAEDLEFNLDYIKYTNKISYLNEVLYLYKTSSNGLNYRYHDNRINIRKKLYEYEKNIFKEKNFPIESLYNEYLKICLSELKQANYLSKSKNIIKILKEILIKEDRRKELQQIKLNGKIKEVILAKLLSNFFLTLIICKIIKLLKK